MKVFEGTRKVATFWNVLADSPHVRQSLKAQDVSPDEVKDVAARLKTVRDGTHFHIGLAAVEDPSQVWKAVGLNGDRLYRVAARSNVAMSNIYGKRAVKSS
jgi:hypothetical protein